MVLTGVPDGRMLLQKVAQLRKRLYQSCPLRHCLRAAVHGLVEIVHNRLSSAVEHEALAYSNVIQQNAAWERGEGLPVAALDNKFGSL